MNRKTLGARKRLATGVSVSTKHYIPTTPNELREDRNTRTINPQEKNMIFELWSRRRKWPKWQSFDTLMKALPREERDAIKAKSKAMLAARKYRVRIAIWTRTGPYWRPRFLWNRKKSRLIRQAIGRLERAALWRKHPKRKPIRLLRSKGWGARACPHLFGRDCLGSWKSWLGGDGVRIVSSLAGMENVGSDGTKHIEDD